MKPKWLLQVILCLAICVTIGWSRKAPKSVWSLNYNESSQSSYQVFPNYMFEGSYVTLSMVCWSKDPDTKVSVQWILEEIECEESLYRAATENDVFILKALNEYSSGSNDTVTDSPGATPPSGAHKVTFQASMVTVFSCLETMEHPIKDESHEPYHIVYFDDAPSTSKRKPVFSKTVRRSNEVEFIDNKYRIAKTWADGMFHLMLYVRPVHKNSSHFSMNVKVEMKNKYGYLPAQDWPKFPYNGVMAFMYLALSTAWILIWARDHEHTYKIHVVLGSVAVAGAMTYTLDFLEMGLVNSGSYSNTFVRYASSLLRITELTLFNIVLMIFSTGYGISRPFLSNKLKYYIVTLGSLLCLILMAYAICVDEDTDIKRTAPVVYKVAFALLVFVKLAIFGWLMGFTIVTLIGLCQRSYSRKIVTFSMFTGACIISFIASSVVNFISVGAAAGYCTKNWSTEWLFEATSGIIHFLLLILLMWLWRPADPMQSYAFAPLLDNAKMADDEEDDDDDVETEKIPLEPL